MQLFKYDRSCATRCFQHKQKTPHLSRVPNHVSCFLYTAASSGKVDSRSLSAALVLPPFPLFIPAIRHVHSYSAPVPTRCEKIQKGHSLVMSKHTSPSPWGHGISSEGNTQIVCLHAAMIHFVRSSPGWIGLFRLMLSSLVI